MPERLNCMSGMTSVLNKTQCEAQGTQAQSLVFIMILPIFLLSPEKHRNMDGGRGGGGMHVSVCVRVFVCMHVCVSESVHACVTNK